MSTTLDRLESLRSWEIHELRGPRADRDVLGHLAQILGECENLYPGIDRWLASKAIPGILSASRCGFVAYERGAPVAASLVKLGDGLKLCSLRVLGTHQERGAGTALFGAAARVLSEKGDVFHFTAPEQLAVERRSYFERLGFTTVGRADRTYRPGEDEWVYQARACDVIRATADAGGVGLFGAQHRADVVLLSLHPHWAAEILAGRKRLELRKRFPREWTGATLVLYATSPDQQVVGSAKAGAVRRMSVDALAASHLGEAGCTERDLRAYAGAYDHLDVVEIDEPRAFARPLPRREAEREVGGRLAAPQAPLRLRPDDLWWKALAPVLAAHGAL